MTNRNLPSLRSIALDPGVLNELSLDTLDALQSEAEAENKIISAAKRAIVACLERRYGDAITAAFSFQGKDFGTVHITDGAYDLEVNVPKKVEWSQDALASARSKIIDSGDDADEYVRVTLSVDERAYTAWPSHIRSVFEPARTVKPGSMTIKLALRKAA